MSSSIIKISFFENIFYWLWNWGERRNEQALKEGSSYRVALPERSFAMISLYQYIYFMFFVSLILHTLNDETIVKLYEIEHITIIPLVIVFPILILFNAIIFNEKKYKMLKEKYAGMSEEEKRTRKKTSVIFAIVSLLTGIATIKLWLLYADKVKEVVTMGL